MSVRRRKTSARRGKGDPQPYAPPEPAVAPLRIRALALYRPPFENRGGIYIFDAAGHMVADCDVGAEDDLATVLRVRGWGRIRYMDDGPALQDTVEDLMIEAGCFEPGATMTEVAARLTAFWEQETESPRVGREDGDEVGIQSADG